MQVYFWDQVKSPRAKVLLNLCVAIGFADIFAILEGVARNNSVCIICGSVSSSELDRPEFDKLKSC